MKKLTVFFAILIMTGSLLRAQGYQALNGSAFTGSTAVFNNPAASVNSAYKWDLTLFSVQAKLSNNSAYIKSDSTGSKLTMKDDYGSKFLHANVDVSLFNLLYKIDNQHAINFGIRARTYNHVKTAPFHYSDSITSFHSFLVANDRAPYVEGFVTHTGWLEADLNYSQVLFENSNSKLSGGVTLQIMKGLSGAYVKLNKISYLESKSATDTSFSFTNGSASYGYGAGYDESSFQDAYKTAVTTLGLSLGVEYMTYNNEMSVNNNLNYDWKIGLSIMDLGANSFKPSPTSGQFYGPNVAVADADVDRKLSGSSNMKDFRDSLSTLFSNNSTLTDNFTISTPTRLIINIDKNLGSHFYVNGDISLNFFSTSSYTKLHTRELNLLTITPRWETIGWGVYLPIQYNTQGQLWLGAAIKAGPLVLGFHNFGILKKDALVNGGGYVLLSIHPFSKKRILSKMDCPE